MAWTPTILRPYLWADGKDPAGDGVAPSGGASVALLYDKARNGRHGSGSGMTYNSSLGALNFSSASVSFTSSTIAAETSIFLVLQVASHSQQRLLDSDSQNQFIGVRSHTGQSIGVLADSGSWILGGGSAPRVALVANTWTIVNVQFTGSTGKAYVNGTEESSVTIGNSIGTFKVGGASGGQAGSPEPFSGKFGDFIVFNEYLGERERKLMEGYLANKWGIESDLPSGHPYGANPPSQLQPSITGIRY